MNGTKDADGRRLPWYITARDGAALAFAGIWQVWDGGEAGTMTTCAIVTTDANADLAHVHHRMPVVVAQADWAMWLGEAGKGAARLMRPTPEGVLEAWRVDPAVNSNRASGADLIRPVRG